MIKSNYQLYNTFLLVPFKDVFSSIVINVIYKLLSLKYSISHGESGFVERLRLVVTDSINRSDIIRMKVLLVIPVVEITSLIVHTKTSS